MPKKPEREYRGITIDSFAASDDGYVVEGYATTFNDPYEMWCGEYEQVDSRAFDGADMSDVIFQFDHAGMVMARQRNNTLQLEVDEHGLHVRADLGGSQQGRDLHEAIKAGLVDRMSWGFTVAEDGWEYDRNTRTATITKVGKVYDVSAVSIPANDGTEISARSYLNGVIEQRKREDEKQELLKRQKDAEEREKLAMRVQLLNI